MFFYSILNRPTIGCVNFVPPKTTVSNNTQSYTQQLLHWQHTNSSPSLISYYSIKCIFLYRHFLELIYLQTKHRSSHSKNFYTIFFYLYTTHSIDRKSIDTIRFYAGRSVRFSTQRKNRAGKISHAAIKTANRVRRGETLRGSHHTRQCFAFSGFVWLLAFSTLRIAITIKRSIGTNQIYQCLEQSQPHAA